MIDCDAFYDILIENDIGFFTGVPDSLLEDVCACIRNRAPSDHHITTPNEGNAVALASGYHLATRRIALVYMQNSGLGNAVNPLTSLTDAEVYSIPVLLLIGWRGEPGVKDEPQHVKKGRVTLPLLQALEIPYAILPCGLPEAKAVVEEAVLYMKERSSPFALVVRKDTFSPYRRGSGDVEVSDITREDAIGEIVKALRPGNLIVGTTGKISRELYEYRTRHGPGIKTDFLTVGSMGHASHIALGIAVGCPDKDVVCLDGDGSVIMHMGALGTIGFLKKANLKHVVLNNGAHDSVGGQPTFGLEINIPEIALACGYKKAYAAKRRDELAVNIGRFMDSGGPALLEVRVRKGARKDLGRPREAPVDNKKAFMDSIDGSI